MEEVANVAADPLSGDSGQVVQFGVQVSVEAVQGRCEEAGDVAGVVAAQ